MRIVTGLLLLILNGTIHAAMLPLTSSFSPTELAEQTELTGTLKLTIEKNDPLIRFIVRNTQTDEEIMLTTGTYSIAPARYEITLVRLDGIEKSPDINYQRITETVTIRKAERETMQFPSPIRRVMATWYDDFSISFATGKLGNNYEVTNILKEHYDKRGVTNSYSELDTVGNMGGSLASRTGVALGYRHLFANSSWLAEVEVNWDQDPDSRLVRTGFAAGAGKYWEGENTTPWISILAGQETATWNDMSIDGTTKLNGSNSVTSLNLVAGMAYRPFNLHISAKFDLLNQSMMANIGYLLGGKSSGYSEPELRELN